MNTISVEEGYKINLPPELQTANPVGSQFVVTIDQTGRIIFTPQTHIRSILLESFGMWADRTDIPNDGVAYVDEMRAENRLESIIQ